MRILVTKKEGGEWFEAVGLYEALQGAKDGRHAAVQFVEQGLIFDPVLMRLGHWPWRSAIHPVGPEETFPSVAPV